jgi:hypothetical protein
VASVQTRVELPADRFSAYMRDFVKQCLEVDVAARPSARALLLHPFLLSHLEVLEAPGTGTAGVGVGAEGARDGGAAALAWQPLLPRALFDTLCVRGRGSVQPPGPGLGLGEVSGLREEHLRHVVRACLNWKPEHGGEFARSAADADACKAGLPEADVREASVPNGGGGAPAALRGDACGVTFDEAARKLAAALDVSVAVVTRIVDEELLATSFSPDNTSPTSLTPPMLPIPPILVPVSPPLLVDALQHKLSLFAVRDKC